MKRLHVGIVAAILLAVASSTVLSQQNPPSAPGKPEAAKASPEVIAAMAPFKPIAQATLDLVTKGDMAAAKTKITELETAWDQKESELRPKYPAEWTLIDGAIDTALTAVRKSATPDADKCKAALQDVIAKIENPIVPPKK